MIIVQKHLEVCGSTTEMSHNTLYQILKLFKSKIKISGKTLANGNAKDVEIALPLKYLSICWRTLEIPLSNCYSNLILTWSPTCAITDSKAIGIFAITGKKLFAPVVSFNKMQSCYNNSNLVLKEQLTGININHKYHCILIERHI